MQLKIIEQFNIDTQHLELIDQLLFNYTYKAQHNILTIKPQIIDIPNHLLQHILQIFKNTIAEYDDTETYIIIRQHHFDESLFYRHK